MAPARRTLIELARIRSRPVAGWRRVAFASSGDFALLENHAVSSTSTRPAPGNAVRTVAAPLVRVAIRPILNWLLTRATVYVVVLDVD